MNARKIIRATAIIGAALAALTIETRALPSSAEPSAQTERKTQDATISVETALVNLDVLVTDPTSGTTTFGYTYDLAGSRTSKTDAGGTTSYAYDANSRLMSAGAQAWAKGGVPKDLALVDPKHKLKAQPRDVFMYFIHEGKVRAPAAAMQLIQRLRQC